MAIQNKITFICEVCGTMSDTHDTWIDASNSCQQKGWFIVKTANAWHHFCDICSKQIQEFIMSLKSPVQKVVSKPKKHSKRKTERQLVQEGRLRLFAHQKKDRYEELQVEDDVYVKSYNKDLNRWQVAKYTTESFHRYKVWGNTKQADETNAELDAQFISRLNIEP